MSHKLNYLPSEYGNYTEVKTTSLEALNDISHLMDNWDGEQARAPHARVIENTKYIFKELLDITFPPTITPNNNGTISCEWETAIGSAHLELGMNRYSMYIRSVTTDTQYFNGEIRNINTALPVIANALNSTIHQTTQGDYND